jgi:hypothetical protein
VKRILKRRDGSQTIFLEKTYGPKRSYRAEVEVSLDELRDLKRAGKLISLRMAETTKMEELISTRGVK